MTFLELLKKMGVQPETPIDEKLDENNNNEKKKTELELLKEELTKLKEQIKKKDSSTDEQEEIEDDEIKKLKEEIESLKEANRALLTDTQQEEEKTVEENLFELYKNSKGGLTNGSNNT